MNAWHTALPLNTIVQWCTGSFKGALNCTPMTPRDASLSDSCTPDHCCFWEYTDSCEYTEKTIFPFLSHWMGYDRGDSFPLDFELNGIPFGSKSKGKLSPRPYPIQFERKSNTSFLSVSGQQIGSLELVIGWVTTLRVTYFLVGGCQSVKQISHDRTKKSNRVKMTSRVSNSKSVNVTHAVCRLSWLKLYFLRVKNKSRIL